MENLLIYFAKVNGLIILFYLMYVLFLRKETFFVSNRFYFIIGLLLSLVLPLITFTKTIWVEPAPVAEFYQETTSVNSDLIAIPIQENPIDWTIILLSSYVIISIAIILKIGVELASFFKRIQKQNKQKGSDYTLINSNSIENPFSFFSYIIINKNMFTEEEIEHILTHESVHVKQKHSIDVLFGKLFCALFWVNPIIWLYRKAMLQNLEFIADNETFQQIENKYEYQKTLLKVVTHQHNLSITNQFYQSLIKKRIVMLHTNQSHKKNAWKYATILPLLVGFMLLFQIETVAQVKENSKVAAYAVEVDYSHIVTSKTTDVEIKEIETAFQDDDYNLKINNIKRNKAGEIIEIKLEFSSKNNSKTKNIKIVKGDKPIMPIKIFIKLDKNEEKNPGFEEVSNVASTKSIEDEETVEVETNTNEYTIDNIVKNGKKVNLIVNGKLQSATVKSKIPLDQEIDILKELDEKDLKSKYNIDKKEGEIYYEINTKKESNKTNSDAVYAVVAAEFSEDETFNNIDRIKSDKTVDAKKALILFNGKEINYEDIDKIDPKTIRSFGTTVASHAIKKYGEKGKNGVIFINTKAYDIENNPAVTEYLNSKKNSEKPKPKTIELKNGDVVVILDGDKIKFPGYPTHYLNQLKLELQGKILEDNIDFFKNYEFEKIKDLIIIEDGMSSKEKKRIKKIIIESK
jgi:beta-lactamase regulating signal transducer with metallopeptidase domain